MPTTIIKKTGIITLLIIATLAFSGCGTFNAIASDEGYSTFGGVRYDAYQLYKLPGTAIDSGEYWRLPYGFIVIPLDMAVCVPVDAIIWPFWMYDKVTSEPEKPEAEKKSVLQEEPILKEEAKTE